MKRDLHHDHDELRTIMQRFAAALARGSVAFDLLHRDRVRFSQIFRAHMAEEEAVALATLGGDPIRVQSSADLQSLFRDYSGHISAWTPQRIKADWNGYRTAVLTLQKRLYARMDWEERQLHPRLPSRAAA